MAKIEITQTWLNNTLDAYKDGTLTKTQEFTDTGSRLSVELRKGGKGTYFWRGRVQGDLTKLTLGGIDVHGLKQAKAWANAKVADRDNNIDIVAVARAAKKAETAPAVDPVRSVRAAFEYYMTHSGNKNKDGGKNKRAKFENDVLPIKNEAGIPLGDRDIGDVTFRDLAQIVALKAERYPGAANRLHSAIAKMWKFCARNILGVARFDLATNVYYGSEKPSEENVGDRSLTDNEIRWLYAALEDERVQYRAFVKLLVLTGLRRTEIAALRKSELVQDEFSPGHWALDLPRFRMKNGEPNLVPLSPEAMEQINIAGLLSDNSVYFFPSNGNPRETNQPETPFSGFTKPHLRTYWNMLNEACSEIAGADGNLVLPWWTLHDFRRTVRTYFGNYGVSPEIGEAVLGHKGTKSKIEEVYNKAKMTRRKRGALNAWGKRVSVIVASTPEQSLKPWRQPVGQTTA